MAIDPTLKNSTYTQLSGAWESNRDFAEMHPHILEGGTYLNAFGSEATENAAQYELRKTWSIGLDLCQDLIDLRVGNLFRSAPVRGYEGSRYKGDIEPFLENVDHGGTSMDDFMRAAVRQMYVNGVDIVVDKAQLLGEPMSRADEKGMEVYLQSFGPLDRYDWDTDHGGGYTFARYALGQTARQDETDGGDCTTEYLTYTRDGWRLYSVSTIGTGNKVKSTVNMTEGTHTLGVCPIVPFYFRTSSRSDYKAVPLSLLTRLTPIAKYMLNLLSQGQLDLYMTVAFLAVFGVDAAEVPKQFGANTVWGFQDPQGKIEHVIHTVDHIVEKREWLQLCLMAQLRIGKLTGVLSELQGRAQSGVQVAIESGPLFNELSSTAAQAEEVERRVMQYVLSRKNPPTGGGLIPLADIGYSVHYNDRYMVEPTAELIAAAKAVRDLEIHDEVPTLLKMAAAKIADAMARDGDPDHDAVVAELEDAVFGGVPEVTVGVDEGE